METVNLIKVANIELNNRIPGLADDVIMFVDEGSFCFINLGTN